MNAILEAVFPSAIRDFSALEMPVSIRQMLLQPMLYGLSECVCPLLPGSCSFFSILSILLMISLFRTMVLIAGVSI